MFLHSSITGAGIDIQHYFLAQPHGLSVHHRGAPELDDLSRGGYDLDRVDLTSNRLSEIDLRPRELKDFILTNRRALVIDAAAMI